MSVTSIDFFAQTDAYLDYRRVVYETSPQTEKSNRSDLTMFRNFVTDNNIEAITGKAAMDFQYYLKKNRKNAGNSLNRKIFTLRTYEKFLQMQNVSDANTLPFRDVLKVRGGYLNTPGALTTNQIKTLLGSVKTNSCLGIRNWALYSLMYGLGLRVGEVHNLDCTDVDLAKGELNVIGKGGKQRTMPIGAELKSIIAEWMDIRIYFKNNHQRRALFVSKKGNRLAIRTIEDNFKKLVDQSDIAARFKVTCHTLRHSFASHLNEKDVDILVLQSLLGHSTPRSTEMYIHPSKKTVKDCLERLPIVKYVADLLNSERFKIPFQTFSNQLE
jgi:site-specific recombinase XerD